MGFIDDNAHVWLLVMVIVVAGAIVGLSVVYQQNFKDINKQYENKLNELNKTFIELTGAKSKLNKTIEELEVKAEREEDLASKYSLVKARKDELETLKIQLEADLQNTKNENSQLKAENSDISRRLDNALEEADNFERKVECYKQRAPDANC